MKSSAAPGGTIWGANAVNAVINIITKNAKDTRGALVSTGGGNLDQGFGDFRYGGGNGKTFNYRIYGKGFTRSPEFHPDRSQFDDWRMGQAGFRADWNLEPRDTLTLQGDLYSGDVGQRVMIASFSAPFTSDVEKNAELAGGNLLGRWQRGFGAGSDIQVQTYYDRTDRRAANFAESRDTFDIDFIHHLILPRRQDFIWGVGVRLSSGNVTEVVPSVTFIPNHRTDKLYSFFLQDEIPIVGNQFSITLGSKFVHNIYTGFEVQPSARLLWTPNQRQTLWAAVTRAVRTPSRIEEDDRIIGLLTRNPLTFLSLIGDGEFSSEHMLGYEVGYRGLLRRDFSLDISTFYNNYTHLLSIEPGVAFLAATPPPAHFIVPFLARNGIFGSTSGFELAPEWKPARWWRLKGSYSYLHLDLSKRSFSLDSSTVPTTEGSSPHHQVVLQSWFNLPRDLEFDQTFRYVSALPAQRVPGYSTADVRLGWRGVRDFDFSIVGQNLLQPQHAEFRGDPGGLIGVKRSAYVKVTWLRSPR